MAGKSLGTIDQGLQEVMLEGASSSPRRSKPPLVRQSTSSRAIRAQSSRYQKQLSRSLRTNDGVLNLEVLSSAASDRQQGSRTPGSTPEKQEGSDRNFLISRLASLTTRQSVASPMVDPPESAHFAYPIPPQEWTPNQNTAGCMRCKRQFNYFLWRHHCRFCGLVVCTHCSPNRVIFRSEVGPERVCKHCYRKIEGRISALYDRRFMRGLFHLNPQAEDNDEEEQGSQASTPAGSAAEASPRPNDMGAQGESVGIGGGASGAPNSEVGGASARSREHPENAPTVAEGRPPSPGA